MELARDESGLGMLRERVCRSGARGDPIFQDADDLLSYRLIGTNRTHGARSGEGLTPKAALHPPKTGLRFGIGVGRFVDGGGLEAIRMPTCRRESGSCQEGYSRIFALTSKSGKVIMYFFVFRNGP